MAAKKLRSPPFLGLVFRFQFFTRLGNVPTLRWERPLLCGSPLQQSIRAHKFPRSFPPFNGSNGLSETPSGHATLQSRSREDSGYQQAPHSRGLVQYPRRPHFSLLATPHKIHSPSPHHHTLRHVPLTPHGVTFHCQAPTWKVRSRHHQRLSRPTQTSHLPVPTI